MKTAHDQIKEALGKVGLAGNHLGLIIGVDHPPHTASYVDGLRHYTPGKQFEAWTAWKLCYEAYQALALLETHAVVPREPTNQMNNAAIDATGVGSDMSWRNKTPQMVVAVAYRAMIAAAERGE